MAARAALGGLGADGAIAGWLLGRRRRWKRTDKYLLVFPEPWSAQDVMLKALREIPFNIVYNLMR